MAKIVLVPVGSLGDVHPLLGVALELQRRGHETILATSNFYEDYITSAGLRYAPVGPHFRADDPEIVRTVLDPRRGPELLYKKYLFPQFARTVSELREVVAGAQLMLTGILGHPVMTVSALTGIPWVCSMLSPMCMWSSYDPPILPPVPWLGRLPLPPFVHRIFLRGFEAMAETWAKPLQEFRHSVGLKPVKKAFSSGMFSPNLLLCLWSKVFGPPQPDWPEQARVCGFVQYDPAAEQPLNTEVEDFLNAGEPPVIFTLGSTVVEDGDALIQKFIETARQLSHRAIVTVGSKRQETYASFNSEKLLIAGYLPYAHAFPRASAIVHQGGVGTTAHGLGSGHPSIVLPSAMDQFDNAYRVQRLKAGEVLPLKKFTSSRLVALVQKVVAEPGYTASAQRCRVAMKNENGAITAADAVEVLLAK